MPKSNGLMWCDVCKDVKWSKVFRTSSIGGAMIRERQCQKCNALTVTIEVPIALEALETLKKTLKGSFINGSNAGKGVKWSGKAATGATVMAAMEKSGIVLLLRPITTGSNKV